MAEWRKTIIAAVMLLVVIAIFAQGVAINIVMEKISREIDTRFFVGKFYWKPKLPALYRPAKAGFVHARWSKLRYSQPFSHITGGI